MNNKTIADIFVDGARKGWNIAVASIVPNVIMAFAVIQVLKITGLLQMLGGVFAPIMAVFGLPGEAAMVLLAAWIANGGGVGVAASLFTAGTINNDSIVLLNKQAPGATPGCSNKGRKRFMLSGRETKRTVAKRVVNLLGAVSFPYK